MNSPQSQRLGSAVAERFIGGVLPDLTPVRRHSTSTPPPIPEIAHRLRPVCQRHGIIALDLFGSVARGEAGAGSDVDLIAEFRRVPGLDFVTVIEEMEALFGVPVDLLLVEDVEEMTNLYRKAAIERDRRCLYDRLAGTPSAT